MDADQATNPRPRCPVCASPYKAQYHALRASKMNLQDIHLHSQRLGRGIKRETFGKHFAVCLRGVTPEVLSQQIVDASKAAQTQAEIDFATMVQQRAVELLAAGDLRVTTQHGLQAQALLDRRAEKQADRDIAINIARLLSGALSMPPGTVIEGRLVDVTPDGLAPEGVYDPVA
jgi:hypothetical protein